MKAKDFDKKFEEGQKDIVDDLDLSSARIGVTRQSIIKVWLVERLQAEAANKPLNGDAASGSH